jgi:hypothetical protein
MKKYSTIVYVAILTLTYPLVARYLFVNHNQFEQIPMILRFNDSTYLASDWATNLNAQFSPRFFFTAYMGILSRVIPLPIVYFIHYLLMVAVITLASYVFAKRLFHSEKVAAITTILLLYGQKITLGGNDLIGSDFDPSRPAFGLTLLAFLTLTSRRYILTAILLTISCYLHPLIGTQMPLILYISALISHYITARGSSTKNTSSVRPVIQSILLYVTLSSPAIISYFVSLIKDARSGISSDRLFTIIAKEAAPFHYLPSSWNISSYALFALLIILAYIGLRFGKPSIKHHNRTFLAVIVGMISVLCFIGAVGTEILTSYPLMIAQFFRYTVFLYWIFAILAYGGLIQFAEKSTIPLPLRILIVFIPFILANGIYINRSTPTAIVFFVTFFLIALGVTHLRKIPSVLLVLVFLLSYVFTNRHYPIHMTEPYPFQTPEVEIAKWARDSTPKNAIFLTPPEFMWFRLIASRAVIVDRLVIPFSKAGIGGWHHRLMDIAGFSEKTGQIITNEEIIFSEYRTIDVKRVVMLKEKYNPSYVITRSENILPYPVMHRSDYYVVYSIENAGNDNTLHTL